MTGAQADTIAAVATGPGGALAVIRVSGGRAREDCDTVFRGRTRLVDAPSGRFYHGEIRDPEGRTVDDVVASVWRAPHSYTGEDVVEFSCHGSRYIRQRILQLLMAQGVRLAGAGEFTMRALMNGRLDLAQAEAVADLIASEDAAAHSVAINQMRGSYSAELQLLRGELLTLASLLELELDFGEEDVEFADRNRLRDITMRLIDKTERLAASFAVGNALKNGVAVAIAGSPNVGKSTLLNALAGDERALVSEIAGTTRDTVEERVNIGGVTFRFIDTAGLRATDDRLEQMGIERTRNSVERADVVIIVAEAGSDAGQTTHNIAAARASVAISEHQRSCVVVNKTDLRPLVSDNPDVIAISALRGDGLDTLRSWLLAGLDDARVRNGDVVVSNARHHEALSCALTALRRLDNGLSATITPDLLTPDIRDALHHLGTITGEVTTDDILGQIFSRFCIGK